MRPHLCGSVGSTVGSTATVAGAPARDPPVRPPGRPPEERPGRPPGPRPAPGLAGAVPGGDVAVLTAGSFRARRSEPAVAAGRSVADPDSTVACPTPAGSVVSAAWSAPAGCATAEEAAGSASSLLSAGPVSVTSGS